MKKFAILPLGKTNIKTGTSKYFNIYETWGETTTYEIHRTEKSYVVVATSGTKPIAKLNEMYTFIHDQTGRFLFYGAMVDFAVGSKLKELIDKYGKSILMYTYK